MGAILIYGVYDAFAQKLVAAVAKLKVGDGQQEGVTQGPLIDQKAVEKVEQHIADAVGKAARVLAGGSRIGNRGYYFPLTVLSDLPDDAHV